MTTQPPSPTTNNSPTPETDALLGTSWGEIEMLNLARKLERERDEARKHIDLCKQENERLRTDKLSAEAQMKTNNLTKIPE